MFIWYVIKTQDSVSSDELPPTVSSEGGSGSK